LIDCQQQTHPLSFSSLYGKKTCKKEQEEEEENPSENKEQEEQNIIKILK
jgi:hypothetical protein